MVENIIYTLSNISNEFGLHYELIQNGVIQVVHKYIQLFLNEAKELNSQGVNEKRDGIPLNVMPTGALNLIKAICILITNLSQNP